MQQVAAKVVEVTIMWDAVCDSNTRLSILKVMALIIINHCWWAD